MSTHSDKRLNPLIQATPQLTLKDCSDCLTYISESVVLFKPSDMTSSTFHGLRAMIECIDMAVRFEGARIADQGNTSQ